MKALRREMRTAVEALEFERAAKLRDEINDLEERARLQGFEAPPRSGAERRTRAPGLTSRDAWAATLVNGVTARTTSSVI